MSCFFSWLWVSFFLFIHSGGFCLCHRHCVWYVVDFGFCYFSLMSVDLLLLLLLFCPGRQLTWLDSKSQHYLCCNRQQQRSQLRSFHFPAVAFCLKPWSLLQTKNIQIFEYSLYRNSVAPTFLGFHLWLYSGSESPRLCSLARFLARQRFSSVLSDGCCLG